MSFLNLRFPKKSADMPEKCIICGNSININDNYWKLKDGYMCKNCQKPFAKHNYNSAKSFITYTAEEVIKLIDTLGLSTKSKKIISENQKTDNNPLATLTETNLNDILQFRDKPFSLTGDIFSECGIPYFIPSEKDCSLIRNDIQFLIRLIKDTRIFNTYKKGTSFEYLQIRADIYTPTKKLKKFPISVYVNDGISFYSIFYDKTGKLGKAEILYTPNLQTGYDIKCKEISGSLIVRRICSYPIGGGPITELYCL